MRKLSITVEHALYAGILLIALALRFISLGAAPLNEAEAQAAYTAHQVARGDDVSFGEQAGYVILASATFSLVTSSEFLARFWPAVFGVALVALPYFWRNIIGPKPAILLSIIFALDPGLVAVSRLASGRMIALAAGLIAITAWKYQRESATAVLGALALLASPTIFFGLLVLFTIWMISPWKVLPNRARNPLVRLFAVGAAFYLLAATLLFLVPNGLSGFGSVIADFVNGLMDPSGVSPLQVLFAFTAYSYPILLFGIIGGIRLWSVPNVEGKRLSLAALVGLLMITLYPGRQVADLLWVIIPLSTLAALEISRYLYMPRVEQKATFGEMGLVVLLGMFLILMLARASTSDPGSVQFRTWLLAAAAVPLLAAIATVLIAYGWSRQAAANGLVWGTVILFAFGSLSASSRFIRSEIANANDLWAPGPGAGYLRLVAASIEDLSAWEQGQPGSISVETKVESDALHWMLRDFPQRSYSIVDSRSQVLITSLSVENNSSLEAYRGQSFPINIHRVWEAWPPNLLSWLLYREAPTYAEQAILWASADIFPQQTLAQQEQLDGAGSSP
jgi:hypothetical protein